ncbi:FAD-dependent oxidoreductase [Desulfovibrio inopinatus]|uniref:FAD-dependent oxidoreductase n=1 Tax=Desulfovibrio inopinatus TaxID=102109 RepID=UPI000424F8A9|nr:FAD-dependent oxidoreductase [Desulfovibrio inopinatus]
MAQHVVIIGAVALGPKAACRFKRLEPDSTVTMIDKSNVISYGGCGIPYYVSGDISEPNELRSTIYHMVRDEGFFRNVKGVDVMARTEALSIDRTAKTVHVKNLDTGDEQDISYDKLVLATGSRPRRLPLPGADHKNVHVVADYNDAIAIREKIAKGQVGRAAIIGAGFIGLEMAEAFADMWGVETTVVEVFDQILPNLVSSNLAEMGMKQMQDNGVVFYLGEKVSAIEETADGLNLKTDKRDIPCDIVIMSAGVIPNSELASGAGLEVSNPGGAIVVNEYMQTTDPDIYAGGDNVLMPNLVSGKSGFYPLGSLANRQGRVIGSNLAGLQQTFPGAVGSFAVKMFECSVAGTGLSAAAAEKAGFDVDTAYVVQFDRAHFYPEKELLHIELVFEKKTGRVLGLQALGGKGLSAVGRVDAVASLLPYKPTVHDISNLELAYSPPFASAMDVLNAAGNVAENILAGRNKAISGQEFDELWAHRDTNNICFLDCREVEDARSTVEADPEHWLNIPHHQIKACLDQIPKDRPVVLVCNTGVRSFEAQLGLNAAGFNDTVNVQGGMSGLRNRGKF